MAKRKTAREKLFKPAVRELTDMPDAWKSRYPPGELLIPAPTDVLEEIQSIPAGQTRSIEAIRESMAKRYGAAAACPLVSGIFWRIVAEAAEEDRAEGKSDIAPYWRVIKPGGKMNEKLPGGIERQAQLLESEGIKIERKGKSAVPVVANHN